jgi:hypothetical protein
VRFRADGKNIINHGLAEFANRGFQAIEKDVVLVVVANFGGEGRTAEVGTVWDWQDFVWILDFGFVPAVGEFVLLYF